jgi:hypothetical protein
MHSSHRSKYFRWRLTPWTPTDRSDPGVQIVSSETRTQVLDPHVGVTDGWVSKLKPVSGIRMSVYGSPRLTLVGVQRRVLHGVVGVQC